MAARSVQAVGVVAVLLVAGACTRDIGIEMLGEVGLSWTSPDGTQHIDRDATLDFGSVPFGQSESRTFSIKNLGPGTLTLASLEHADGVAVRVGGQGDEGSVFDVPFNSGQTLGSNQATELTVTYSPVERTEQTEDVAVLVMHVENARAGQDTAKITLRGLGVQNCPVPAVIDFGRVMVGGSQPDAVVVSNAADSAEEATLGAITSESPDDAKAFHWGEGLSTGPVMLDPHSTRPFALTFQPQEAKEYVASVSVRPSANCPERQVQLRGVGVASALRISPARLDFGYVPVGASLMRTVTFTNVGRTPITLSEFTLPASAGELALTIDGSLTVPAAHRDEASGIWVDGTAELTVICTPSRLGSRGAGVRFKSDFELQPTFEIQALWHGGGANVELSPKTVLEFGKVAYFPSKSTTVKRKLQVTNTGLVVTDSAANLHLSEELPDGTFGPSAHMEITPLNAETDGTEFVAALLSSYDNTKGLPGQAGQNSTFIEVAFSPSSLGTKKAELAIYTNVVDQPVVREILTAEAVSVPSCRYSVSESSLDFGVVHAPATYVDRTVQIRNLGTAAADVCLLPATDTSASSDAAFSVISGATPQELMPGEVRTLVVRAWPRIATPPNGTTLTGSLDVYVSSDVKPLTSLPLTAQLKTPCVDISPADFDFGTVALGCASATRTFNVYNVCDTAVTLSGIELVSAAGQAPGDPGCMVATACPEFTLPSSVTIPSGGLTLGPNSAPVTFQVKYRPIDVGTDLGTVKVVTAPLIGGDPNDRYFVTLHGSGDATGTQTDDLSTPANPKADVLLVIDDDTAGMPYFQYLMMTSADKFLEYANTANVDFHIGVTTSNAGYAGADNGQLISSSKDPDAVLTPASKDLLKQLQAKIKIGYRYGSRCVADPAVRALTPPMIDSDTDNIDFLRDDASLAVVALSNAWDPSPGTMTGYLDRLWNVKRYSRRNQVTFSAIAGFSAACKAREDGDVDGKLAFYTTETAGEQGDICAPSYDDDLRKIGKLAFGLRKKFFLTSIPDLSQTPISITVNGQPLAATNASGTAWSYDPITNSITFDELYAPVPGADVKVTYQAECYP